MDENDVIMPKISYSSGLTFEKMGLYNGRQRNGVVYHNSGWYVLGKEAGSCPKIGWGDLGPRDILNIEVSLDEGEALFILHEEDSFWNFVTEAGMIGAFCKTTPTEKDPGLDYILAKVAGIVVKGAFLRVQQYSSRKTGEKYYQDRKNMDLEETAIRREDIKDILNIS